MSQQPTRISDATIQALAQQARSELARLTSSNPTITYQALAIALGLRPPHSIHRVILALEQTMIEDAAQGRAFIAARVCSRHRNGLPAKGYFDFAAQLGRYPADPGEPDAIRWHADELQRLNLDAT